MGADPRPEEIGVGTRHGASAEIDRMRTWQSAMCARVVKGTVGVCGSVGCGMRIQGIHDGKFGRPARVPRGVPRVHFHLVSHNLLDPLALIFHNLLGLSAVSFERTAHVAR